ncbi:energy transducer TonB [Rhodocyclus purpureus]|uniref:energy transducer TonB n=1 Tax=Rhodocyclus purpureus TaxID=1067 RepID=UPI0019118CC7|nr:TonB family protein [Rhodocyclus purpureus]MBK5914062.1 protein TolA [Rhodocyclus purpureus]
MASAPPLPPPPPAATVADKASASAAAAAVLPERRGGERPEPGKRKALLLAIAVHLLLIGALVLGVSWKSQQPASVAVEVWRDAPAVTPPAPRPAARPEPRPEPKPAPKPEPKPEVKAPVKPDIALKDEKKKEEKKPEPKKPETKPEAKPEPRRDVFAEAERERKQLERQQELRRAQERASAEARQLNELQAEQASAARTRGLADYIGKVRGKIRGNIVLPPGIQGNPKAVFEATQLPSGEVISVRVLVSSGNKALDEAVERAIRKSSPLPKPDQPELFERVLKIPYSPLE